MAELQSSSLVHAGFTIGSSACPSHPVLPQVLEVMWEDDVALCLTPQAFSNTDAGSDVFNNKNLQFWEYVLPGCDALGYVACTGTNFCIRACALATVGWFPEYTITEGKWWWRVHSIFIPLLVSLPTPVLMRSCPPCVAP